MRISTKGRGIIRAQQGAVARPNPKENYKLPVQGLLAVMCINNT